jgi:hypothetical protein
LSGDDLFCLGYFFLASIPPEVAFVGPFIVPVMGLGGVELSGKGGPTSFERVEVGRERLSFGMGDGRCDEERGWEVLGRDFDATSEGRAV